MVIRTTVFTVGGQSNKNILHFQTATISMILDLVLVRFQCIDWASLNTIPSGSTGM